MPKKTVIKSLKKASTPKKKPKSKLMKRKQNARKSKKVSHIQKGYHSITPYLIVNECADAINFYKKAFGAKELFRMESDGKISHAELKIGDARIMIADAHDNMSARSPKECLGSCVGIHLYIKNVDDVVDRAVSLGAILEKPVETQFFGDRNGTLKDPHGHIWYVSTHVEDVTPAQIRKRAAELFNQTK